LTAERHCPDNANMRPSRLSFVLVPLASLSSTLFFGCFSGDDNTEAPGIDADIDTGTAGDSSSPDVTTSPMDASTQAEAATPAPDAGVDATPDVAEEPAPPLAVTVVVVGPGGPESGVTIVFDDSTGAFVSQSMTDTNGRVTQVLAANSMVTAVLGSADLANLVTVTGVQPGDTLTAIDGSPQPNVEVQVTDPASPPEGTSELIVNAGDCAGSVGIDSNNPPVLVENMSAPFCIGPTGQFPLLSLATDGDGTTLGYTFQKNFQIAVDGGTPDITLGTTWQTQLGQETVSFTNVPSNLTPQVLLGQYASAVPYTTSDNEPNVVDAGGSSSFETYPGYSDFLQAEIQLQNETPGGATNQVLAVRGAAPTTAQPDGTIALDLSALLPAITGVTIDATTPARPSATVASAATLAGASGMFVTLDWADVPDGGAGPTARGRWLIVGPPSATAIQYPSLGNLTGAPTSDAQWTVETAAAIGGAALPTYGAVRASAGTLNLTLNNSSFAIVPGLPANGASGTMGATLFFAFVQGPVSE
jgi:hypothetical protein